MTKFKEFADNTYSILMLNRLKNKKLNPKTNRIKTFKKVQHHITKVKPSDRTFKNLPKYADGKSKVSFQNWLLIKGQKRQSGHDRESIGKSEALGAWVGWSHRAVYAFKAGDKVTGNSAGKKVEYPKLSNGDLDYDNGKYEADFTIKDDVHAKQVAITFADNVS